MHACRAVPDRRGRGGAIERLVLLQSQGQEVPDGQQGEPRDCGGVLEGNGSRQAHPHAAAARDGAAQDAGVLPGSRAARPEDGLDHA